MEDDKKKNKKNKRKKNKQNKTSNDGNANATVVNGNGSNEHECEHEHHSDQVSELTEVQNGVHQPDAAVDLMNAQYLRNGAEIGNLGEDEKQRWLQREAVLEQTIQQLQNENDSHLQREAVLEQTIQQLQNENDSHLQREATLEETIKQLLNENKTHIQKEATLEDRIIQLRSLNDSYLQKKAIFEESIKRLENENDSREQKKAGLEKEIKQLKSEIDFWLQKEASLADKIRQLESEKDFWNLTQANLVDKIKQLETEKDSWILTQNTAKETIARLTVDIARLRMQVVELEESRNGHLKENRQLMESISALQSQLQNPEMHVPSANSSDEHGKHPSEKEELNSQIEAACALVDKLITDNSELVEKVNELYVKLERQNAAVGLLAAPGNSVMIGNVEIANVASPMPVSENSVLGDTMDSMEGEPAAVVRSSPEVDPGEIVQIPLDDGEAQDLESQVFESDDKDPVPLSDAPLIGAPFRLISFFAKYVAGADLVHRSP